jgi:hypothetical protein
VVSWLDARVRDATGRRLGRVKAIVADEQGTPWWIVLRHRGQDVVAPVASVVAGRHHEIHLDRAVESLAPCPTDIDERAHDALVARFGLSPQPATFAGRGPRDECTPRRTRRFTRRSA